MARIDDAVILAEQLLARVFGDRAELVVHEGDLSLRIGDGHDGVLVQRGLQVDDLLERYLQFIFRPFALGDVDDGATARVSRNS